MDSEKIKMWLKDFRITIPVGVVLGLILGLIIGWGIWPVQWTDLAPYHLRPDLREDYLRMAIHTTTTVGDASIANKAWAELEDTAQETLDAVRGAPGFLLPDQITSFVAIVGAGDVETPLVEQPTEAVEVVEEVPADESSGPNWFLLSGLCLVLIVAGGAAFYFFVLRGRSPREVFEEDLGFRKEATEPIYDDEGYYPPAEVDDYGIPEKNGSALPVAQFMTTYAIGDDLYDDSFSIDAPTGEFLGECGVGISETVGVGDPKHVAAFEVWLFDKDDIQTITKVIMSEHAFNDDKIRMRLESKGEPILAEIGKQVLLETATLQLEARIIDTEYGEGAAPDQSFFERIALELAVWPKKRMSI